MAENSWRSSIRQVLSSLKNIRTNENAPPVDEQIKELPYYHNVPKDPLRNLDYRKYLLDVAYDDVDIQQQLWIASSRDILFFVNTFLWVFEPRESMVLPFITWQYQDEDFVHLNRDIGVKDIGVEKSRDMGVTWETLTVLYYRWMFRSRQIFGVVSRTEDVVDKTDDPDTLFWKLDFHTKNLPRWMQPNCERIRLSLKNTDTDSVITGYSATADVARGGRKTAFLMDEAASWQIDAGFSAWASTQHVTRSRVMVSTPQGMSGIFAEQMQKKDAAMTKISLHWALNPLKNAGLYRSFDGELTIIDTDYEFDPHYPFVIDGKLRSPWYDEECRRHPVPALIAQELDIDYGGSGFPFFDANAVADHAARYACEPTHCGDLDYDSDNYESIWRKEERGPLQLWIQLTTDERPPSDDYAIGCDIATGSGGDLSTNSVASVVNQNTGEKVAEYATNTQAPYQFANTVIALRKWFASENGEAFVIWERNGPGYQFGKHFMDRSPHRVYYKEALDQYGAKVTKSPGWHSGKAEKKFLLGEYGKAIVKGYMINRCASALDEMLHYVYLPDGKVEHDRSKSTLDPTSSGENHGDRVIADALAWRMVRSSVLANTDEDGVKKKNVVHKVLPGSMAWRMEMIDRKNQERQESWL